MWKKTMTWLGLDPDADYDNAHDPHGVGFTDPALGGEGSEGVTPVPVAAGPVGRHAGDSEPADFSAVRSLGPMTERDPDDGYIAADALPMSNQALRPVDVPERNDVAIGTVQAVPASPASKPQLVAPRSFNDAQEIADRFRGGAAVILNLQETDAALGRRLIDFCSGLCYGLRGQMQRVGDRVFLLTPADVHLSPDDHRLMRDSGLLN